MMNILIIQILRMGDAVQLVPLIKKLKETFPESRLFLLTSRLGAAVLASQPELHQIQVLNQERIALLSKKGARADILSALDQLEADLKPVFETRWDWIINFSYTFSSALLSFLLKADHHTGFVATRYRQYVSKEKWFAFSMASFMNRRYSMFNWVDINRCMLGLGTVAAPLFMEANAAARRSAADYLKRSGWALDSIVGIHPGASGGYKCWPVEKFARLGRCLVQRHEKNILVFGGEKERPLGRRLQELVGENVIDLSGRTDLDELKAYLSLCDVLITNDTGPMHIAAAVGTPVIALFFATHFIETGPYGAGHMIIHPNLDCYPCQNTAGCKDKRCLSYISPDTVEAMVINGKTYGSGSEELNDNDNGCVKAYFSRFDPWGNLEWLPLDGRSITFAVIERLLLKLVWLFYTDIIDDLDAAAGSYLSNVFSFYAPPARSAELPAQLAAYAQRLSELNDSLKEAQTTAMGIQAGLLAERVDMEGVKLMGSNLGRFESKMAADRDGTSVDFVKELLVLLLENIERTSPLKLCIKTIDIYREMQAISNGLGKLAFAAGALLYRNEIE